MNRETIPTAPLSSLADAKDSTGVTRRAILAAGAATIIMGEAFAGENDMTTKPVATDIDARIASDPDNEAMTPPDSEEQRIADLVTANQILADQGVNDAFGHVTVRSFANPKHYFMSRSRAPELVTRADIMEFNENSEPIDRRNRIMYEERYIHGEIFRTRPDVMCIVHSHTSVVIPFAGTGVPLRTMIHMAAFLPQPVPVFEIRDVEGPDNHILVTNPRSGAALAKSLGEGSAVLMRGHGSTVVGPSVRQAVYRSVYLKAAAEIQLMATQLGGNVQFLSPAEAANFNQRLSYMGTQQPLRPWPVWAARARANRRRLFGDD